ncbi:heme lyase CcmF/NrfE family subunit [Paenibacillus sp. Dod16]|uniref:heme lyase CcmF/NrfE family subunit n=1 Tax=Paenibacillus sp. Dod16 TaxID=3416392 RepID=UPI003CF16D78
MYLLGNTTIYLGLALSLYSIVAMILGILKQNQRMVDSGKRGLLAVFILTALAMLIMFYLLGTSQFQYRLVSNYTSSDLPLMYKLSALWAGSAGSLLLWLFLLTSYTVMVVYSRKMSNNPMVPYIASIMAANSLFFFFILAFIEKPFVLLDYVPTEGRGLNPQLQNPGMMIHPITTYLGYVGLAVPFAFAMAALILKNMDNFWLRMTRRWTLIAWLFLSLGNLLGAHWAYMELGWGGYWAWDPVENASFMPWLTVTAFLHSVMMQERKNMLKVWNVGLIIASYALTLFGTFLVRSGILTSVHAFANSSLGTWFLIFLAVAVFFSLYVLMNRYHLLRDAGRIESLISKETSFLVNNLLLVGAAFAILWGTIFPLVSEAVRGTRVTVGPPFFNTVQAPILLSLIFVMGVCPLISWQRSTTKHLMKNFLIPALLSLSVCVILLAVGMRKAYPIIAYSVVCFMLITHFIEFYRGIKARRKMTGEGAIRALYNLTTRNRRRYGGYIVHFGVALIALGIIGSQNFEQQTMRTVGPGESFEIGSYSINYDRLNERSEGINRVVYAELLIAKNGDELGLLRPEKVFYGIGEDPSTEVGLYSNWREDLYVVLSSWEPDGRATFVAKVNPMMNWIWFGGMILVMGTVFALWNGKYGNITPRYSGIARQVA